MYISRKKVEGGNTVIRPVSYYDIGFTFNGYQKEVEHTLDIFYHAFYSAYIKAPKFGMYYISALSNFLRSCDRNFEWDFEKNNLLNTPLNLELLRIC